MNSSFNILLKLALLGSFISLPGALAACVAPVPVFACQASNGNGFGHPVGDGCPGGYTAVCCDKDPVSRAITRKLKSSLTPRDGFWEIPRVPLTPRSKSGPTVLSRRTFGPGDKIRGVPPLVKGSNPPQI
ncbi:hypothetical protein Pst134EB_014432 [Puccinia striiformis f. sp. tritici]|nr:hypothetical protein Pst134EB_014432 [Puccinia striiformis f. sp. tritici]